MNKLKLSPGLASLILIACLFTGWETMLIVVALMLIFCEIKNVEDVVIRVLTFFVGLTLFTMLWNLIVDGYSTVYASLQGMENVLNSYLPKPIDINGLYRYVLTPIKGVIGVLDIIVKYLVVLIKFIFIVSFLTNKTPKENFLTKFINKYVTSAVKYVSNSETKEEK